MIRYQAFFSFAWEDARLTIPKSVRNYSSISRLERAGPPVAAGHVHIRPGGLRAGPSTARHQPAAPDHQRSRALLHLVSTPARPDTGASPDEEAGTGIDLSP